ncbi:uncharacterized protein si:ch1073-220m6.1 [Alosa sapidissima]|uniref:uncharacterized protein si:ch1073-220m6.1 n=1 Tax=Alosa sapidissima TaxID=34773 RepID=UPI001C0A0AA7|nr:uncharacterized protein si:ch1073-220m6.1 [Alosa sapidissima]
MCTMCSTALLFWLTSAAVTVSCSSGVSTEIHGRKGHFIQMNFPAQPEQNPHATWMQTIGNHMKRMVQNNSVTFPFKHRVAFFKGNLSIQLNNLTDNDSGVYIGYKHEDQWTEVAVVSYKLVIQDAVSTPVIKISPIQPLDNTSGQNCSFNVNCSSSKSWASYSCDENGCTYLQSSLSAKDNINITSANGHVKCNASNPVSTEMSSQQFPKDCGKVTTMDSRHNLDLHRDVILTISAIICAALLLLVCGTLIWKKCRNSKAEETPNKRNDIPTVIVTGSDADEPGMSIYSVINKAAKCSVVDHSAKKTTTSQNKTYRPQNTEEEHRSQRQQRKKGKQRPLVDNDITIYSTATKPLETQNPTEDTDRTIYTTATKPLEGQRPQEDTTVTVYDTARARTQTETETNQADTVYYTLGHMTSGQQ